MFVDNILKIPELATSHATQQLIADIGELEEFCLLTLRWVLLLISFQQHPASQNPEFEE